jgi:exopolysaccharide biosynthesis polyprenyl glycosylphosphotransferase
MSPALQALTVSPSASAAAPVLTPRRRRSDHVAGTQRLRAVPAAPAAPTVQRDCFRGARWTLISAASDAFMLCVAVLGGVQLSATHLAPSLLALAVGLAAATMLRLGRRGFYGTRLERTPLLDSLRETAAATTWAAAAMLALGTVTELGTGATGTILWIWALATGGLVAFRLLFALARRNARLRGRSGRRALIVGAGFVGAQLERRMLAKPEHGLIPVGFLDSDPPPADRFESVRGPVLGGPDELERVAAQTGAEQVIIAFSNAPDSEVLPLIRRCEQLGLEVAVVPRLFENVNDRQWVEHIGGLPLCGLRRVDPKSWQFTVKHALDRAVAAALVVLAAPLLAVLAAAVKLSSPGPALFRQRRIGRDGQEFDILKFRSMRIDSDGPSASFVKGVQQSGSAPGGIEGIDRRTPIGAFIRRTSLDELPQLLNVLFGHMSLVGPRPERPEFVRLFGTNVRRYGDRHRVKSGMTGWAQVHGLRGQTSLAERVEWDNFYIQNWSLWLDLKIMLMTPLAVLDAAPGEGKRSVQSVPAAGGAVVTETASDALLGVPAA